MFLWELALGLTCRKKDLISQLLMIILGKQLSTTRSATAEILSHSAKNPSNSPNYISSSHHKETPIVSWYDRQSAEIVHPSNSNPAACTSGHWILDLFPVGDLELGYCLGWCYALVGWNGLLCKNLRVRSPNLMDFTHAQPCSTIKSTILWSAYSFPSVIFKVKKIEWCLFGSRSGYADGKLGSNLDDNLRLGVWV